MHELASVALWEHFSLDPTTAEWWNTNAVPVTAAPTSGGVTGAGIAAMEHLELCQTVRRDPCLYAATLTKYPWYTKKRYETLFLKHIMSTGGATRPQCGRTQGTRMLARN